MPDLWTVAALTLTGVLTGFIDAIAGGGGLIMMPALLSAGLPPHIALGTNKLQSAMGTTMAANTFWRHGLFAFRANLGTLAVVFAGAAAGAVIVQVLDASVLQVIVPGLLLAVALYVVLSPRMDDEDVHNRLGPRGYAPVAGGIGFYDGFFGPGTGSFFAASLVGLRGLGLTRATAMTKLLNATSNCASLIVFAIGGKVIWLLGLSIGLGAMLGNWLGSHTAMRFGARLIRPLLATISVLLTARLAVAAVNRLTRTIGGKVIWLLGLSIGLGAMLGNWLGSHTAMRFGARLIRPLLATISVLLTARLVWQWFA